MRDVRERGSQEFDGVGIESSDSREGDGLRLAIEFAKDERSPRISQAVQRDSMKGGWI